MKYSEVRLCWEPHSYSETQTGKLINEFSLLVLVPFCCITNVQLMCNERAMMTAVSFRGCLSPVSQLFLLSDTTT